MNLDYSQFFHMMPEVTLMALLVIVFIVDFVTAHKAPIVLTDEKTAPSPRPSGVYLHACSHSCEHLSHRVGFGIW